MRSGSHSRIRIPEENSNKRLTSLVSNKYREIFKEHGIIHLKTDNTDLYKYTGRVIRGNRLQMLISTDDLYSACTECGRFQ
jgi:tRNA G46 methylase TrmB